MSNRLNQLLKHWLASKDSQQWVLATIIETDGSSYRKAGAMMMINSLGQYFGLLSGGCLESDIMLQARRCWDTGHNRIIEYDMREEEDLAWQLGIGCGGMVRILLQPVSRENHYLSLDNLYRYLDNNQACEYQQVIHQSGPENSLLPCDSQERATDDSRPCFVQIIKPVPHLALFGGGVDARPVVAIAMQLGWQLTLIDPRISYARSEQFDPSITIVRQSLDELTGIAWLQKIDMALIMTHNIQLDGQSLALVQSSSACYVGMLGPTHRTERVLAHMKLDRTDLIKPLANPVGLRLGGELPESIALSMLAEAHAYIEQADGQSISGMLDR